MSANPNPIPVLLFSVFLAAGITMPVLAAASDVQARKLVAAAEDEKWDEMRRLAPLASDPLVRAYADWLDFQQDDTAASFEDIAAFLDAHPTWPRLPELRRNAEKALDGTQGNLQLLTWFERNRALTGEGALAHLDALSALGRTADLPGLARTYWISRNFDDGIEPKFLRSHGKYLRKSDHEARLDRLIWDRNHSGACRMLKRMDSGQAALGTARISLARRSPGVDSAITRVPATLRDSPELWFERLRWRRIEDMDSGAADILSRFQGTRPMPERWSLEARILARRALEDGQYSEAAKLVTGHGLNGGGEFAESEFFAGWIHLRFLNEPNAAEDHFETLYNGVSYPISRSRGAYWKARAAKARGNDQLARKWFDRAAGYPTTFYGQEATRELGRALTSFTFSTPSDTATRRAFVEQELVQLVHRLHELGANARLRTFLLHLAGLAENAEERLLVAQLAHESGRPREAIRAVKRVSQLDNLIGIAGYPMTAIPATPETGNPPEALVLAVIRQESGFDRTTLSGAGAHGMMQLMPGTAKRVASSLSLPYRKPLLTEDPAYNIRLGRAYLGQMLDRYAGSAPLALAAYNAGPHRVDRWLDQFGDPRAGRIDMIDWIESIPFAETRNYVQRVSEARRVYEYLLANGQVAEVGAVPLSTEIGRQ